MRSSTRGPFRSGKLCSTAMNSSRSPIVLLVAAAVALVAVLIIEAIFDDTINWVAVVLVSVAAVIGIIIGDAVRRR